MQANPCLENSQVIRFAVLSDNRATAGQLSFLSLSGGESGSQNDIPQKILIISMISGGEGGIRTPMLKNADKYGLLRRSYGVVCTTALYQ
jgi:hypothetical protein